MNFQEFRQKMFELSCFTSDQVYAWRPDFDKNNLGRWVKKGYLVKLRNGFYSFPEYLGESDFALYIANRIYRPSYISLHTALSFYELIPESVVQITSVSTLKTVSFQNRFGTYSYKTIRPDLMFGFDARPLSKEKTLLFARPEKALLDLLYLYPFYNTKDELDDLRLDADLLTELLNVGLLNTFMMQFKSLVIEKRVKLLLNIYGL